MWRWPVGHDAPLSPMGRRGQARPVDGWPQRRVGRLRDPRLARFAPWDMGSCSPVIGTRTRKVFPEPPFNEGVHDGVKLTLHGGIVEIEIVGERGVRQPHRRVRKQGNAVPSGGKQRLPRRQLMPVTRRADQPRSGRKKARMSSASSSGCSIAAKWPPRGITVQRRILV